MDGAVAVCQGANAMKRDETKIAALLLAAHGFRNNSPIEGIHAGTWPKNAQGVYAVDSEVIVTTLDGGDKIPWADCSRIHDSEMKEMNKAVVNNIYSLLSLLQEFGTLGSGMGVPTIGMNRSMPLGTRRSGRDCNIVLHPSSTDPQGPRPILGDAGCANPQGEDFAHGGASSRLCEERSDETIQPSSETEAGSLRAARNDGGEVHHWPA